MAREADDQAAGGTGGEGRRQVTTAAALGADPGQQQPACGISSAQARELLGHGRADDGADVGQSGSRPTRGAPSSPISGPARR